MRGVRRRPAPASFRRSTANDDRGGPPPSAVVRAALLYWLLYSPGIRAERSAVVDLSAMARSDDGHDQRVVEDLVNDAIVAHPNTPGGVLPHQLGRTRGPRVIGQAIDGDDQAGSHRPVELAQLPSRSGGELDGVAQPASSSRTSANDTRSPSSSALAARYAATS